MIVWKLDQVLRVKGVKGRELARRMAIGENYLTVEIADKVEVKIQKSAVTSVLPKGTLKNL